MKEEVGYKHRLWYIKQMDYESHPSSVIIDLIRRVIGYFSQKYILKSGRSLKWLKMIPINPGEIPKKVLQYMGEHPPSLPRF